MSVIAIVPMRHVSERVPGKNYRSLGGIPLFHHVIKSLQGVPEIDEIIIDTDSQVILEDASERFPSVKRLVRPDHLRDGSIPMNDVLKNALRDTEAELVVQTHSTTPFLRSATISSAIRTLRSSLHENDSLFGVTRLQARLWASGPTPINHNPAVLERTQDLPPVFLENSSLFVFPPSVLFATNNRIGRSPLMFEVSGIEALDIDVEEDFILATAVHSSGIVDHE